MLLSTLWWMLGLTLLSSGLVHLEYVWNFSGETYNWFGRSFWRSLVMYEGHMTLIFGPSAVLFWLWWREKQNWFFGPAGLSLAVNSYFTWQPPILALLSRFDLYPTHREAAFNWFFRGDWLLYPSVPVAG